MNTTQKTDRLPQQDQPYTPTPDVFERRLRAWVHLPADESTTPETGKASAPSQEPSARDQD